MSEAIIKLFGKTIPLPTPALYHHHGDFACSASTSANNEPCSEDLSDKTTASFHDYESGRDQQGQEINRESPEKETTDDKQEDSTSNQETEDSKDQTTSAGISEKPKTPSAGREASPSQQISKNEDQQSDTSNSTEKSLKKPDKIIPCPRCNSMDTKFCYYNNYNVNQPRHFCKNCQRYWTSGGTMRNVPVGAGRRKNKSSSASHYRHIYVSEALRTAQVHAVNGIHNPSLGSNSTVLTFGSDSPLSESVASVLNLTEKTQKIVRNGYYRPEQRTLVSCGRTADTGDAVAVSRTLEKGGNGVSQETATKNYHQGIAPQVPCFPGPPWPYPWNSTMPAPPGFCPPGFPVSFYPAPAYWGCTVPNPWNVPPCLSTQSPSVNHCTAVSFSPTSPLGKHLREGNILNPANSEEPSGESNCSEQSVLVPKTLRIDDPTEAAKSSIWATVGIKSEKSNLNEGGLFNGFQLKNEGKNHISDIKYSVLEVNPAALSRSLNFHESN